MNTVRYSFIIPVKDQITYTRDCLLSWFGHTSHLKNESEILIVDDGSNERSKDFLGKLPSPIRVITNESNLGYAKSNNRAAEEAKGERLVLLNNDLVLQPGWFDAMLTASTNRQSESIIGNVQRSRITGAIDHVGKFFDDGGIPRHFGQLHPELFPLDPQLDFCKFPSTTAACWLIKKSLFQRLGGFSEDYVNGFEDDDFCLRAREQGVEVGVALRSWVYHYVSVSDGRKEKETNNIKVFRNKWESTAKQWHEEHYQNMLNMLSTWSLN